MTTRMRVPGARSSYALFLFASTLPIASALLAFVVSDHWQRPARVADTVEAASGARWTSHIARADEALVRRDLRAAERAWHDAYVSALGSGRWEGMLEVGDAALRIGRLAGAFEASRASARQAYLGALVRARRTGSLDGVLRAAEAFAALGDRAVVDQCLGVGDELAGRAKDRQARVRVGTARGRLAAGPAETGAQ